MHPSLPSADTRRIDADLYWHRLSLGCAAMRRCRRSTWDRRQAISWEIVVLTVLWGDIIQVNSVLKSIFILSSWFENVCLQVSCARDCEMQHKHLDSTTPRSSTLASTPPSRRLALPWCFLWNPARGVCGALKPTQAGLSSTRQPSMRPSCLRPSKGQVYQLSQKIPTWYAQMEQALKSDSRLGSLGLQRCQSYKADAKVVGLYTVSQKKTRHQTLAHNFPKC